MSDNTIYSYFSHTDIRDYRNIKLRLTDFNDYIDDSTFYVSIRNIFNNNNISGSDKQLTLSELLDAIKSEKLNDQNLITFLEDAFIDKKDEADDKAKKDKKDKKESKYEREMERYYKRMNEYQKDYLRQIKIENLTNQKIANKLAYKQNAKCEKNAIWGMFAGMAGGFLGGMTGNIQATGANLMGMGMMGGLGGLANYSGYGGFSGTGLENHNFNFAPPINAGNPWWGMDFTANGYSNTNFASGNIYGISSLA